MCINRLHSPTFYHGFWGWFTIELGKGRTIGASECVAQMLTHAQMIVYTMGHVRHV